MKERKMKERKIKQYRLKIPKMIRREDAVSVLVAERIDKNNGGVWLANGDGGDIPAEWLEEIHQCCNCGIELDPTNASWHWILNNDGTEKICQKCDKNKDEPMNEVDWAISVYGNRDNIFTKCFSHEDILQAFRAGAAENEKKHRLQQSFEEWWGNDGSCLHDDVDFRQAKMIWQAHAKATNTES